jgi:hypothetical protein
MARDRRAAETAGQQWKLLLTAALTVAALVVPPVRISSRAAKRGVKKQLQPQAKLLSLLVRRGKKKVESTN